MCVCYLGALGLGHHSVKQLSHVVIAKAGTHREAGSPSTTSFSHSKASIQLSMASSFASWMFEYVSGRVRSASMMKEFGTWFEALMSKPCSRTRDRTICVR